jgi:uncharacterized protein YbaR (Trm112 family)
VVTYGRVVLEPTVLAPPLVAGAQGTSEGTKAKTGSRAWSWAALMHRAFALDVLACPQCGGRLQLIATLHDPAAIRKAPRAPGDGLLRVEPRSGATRVLIGAAWARRASSYLRRETSFLLIGAVHLFLDAGGLRA